MEHRAADGAACPAGEAAGHLGSAPICFRRYGGLQRQHVRGGAHTLSSTHAREVLSSITRRLGRGWRQALIICHHSVNRVILRLRAKASERSEALALSLSAGIVAVCVEWATVVCSTRHQPAHNVELAFAEEVAAL